MNNKNNPLMRATSAQNQSYVSVPSEQGVLLADNLIRTDNTGAAQTDLTNLSFSRPSQVLTAVAEVTGRNEIAKGNFSIDTLGLTGAKYLAHRGGAQLNATQIMVRTTANYFDELALKVPGKMIPDSISLSPAEISFDDNGLHQVAGGATSVVELKFVTDTFKQIGWYFKIRPFKTTRGLATFSLKNAHYTAKLSIPYNATDSELVALPIPPTKMMTVGMTESAYEAGKDTVVSVNASATDSPITYELSTGGQAFSIQGVNCVVWIYPILVDRTVTNLVASLASSGKIGCIAESCFDLY